MKLRMTHNSIRIRVRKSELITLQQNQLIEEQIGFPSGVQLKFAISIQPEMETLQASMDNNALLLSIPTTTANDWINTNSVGIESNINLPNKEQLHLLIEKDFPCLDRADEDKSDTFWELAPDSPESC